MRYLLFLVLINLLSCAVSDNNTMTTVAPLVESELNNEMTYFEINLVNHPSMETYFGGDKVILDLTYNISNDDYDTTNYSYFHILTIGTSLGQFRDVILTNVSGTTKTKYGQKNAPIRTDTTYAINDTIDIIQITDSSKIMLIEQRGVVRIETNLYNSELPLDETKHIAVFLFRIEFPYVTLSRFLELWNFTGEEEEKIFYFSDHS